MGSRSAIRATTTLKSTAYPDAIYGSTWDAFTSFGFGTGLTPDTANSVPVLATDGTNVYGLFWNSGGTLTVLSQSGSSWTGSLATVGGYSAAVGSDPALAWVPDYSGFVPAWADTTGIVHAASPGVPSNWGNPNTRGTENLAFAPALAPDKLGDGVLVYFNATKNLQYEVEANGAQNWSNSSPVNGTTPAPASRPVVTTAPILNGVMLVYRATDNSLRYTYFNGTTWSTIAAVTNGATTITALGTPALAKGELAYAAELAYIDATTQGVYHTRYSATAASWTAPVLVTAPGQSYSVVAIASGP